jgi:hypothetical protein
MGGTGYRGSPLVPSRLHGSRAKEAMPEEWSKHARPLDLARVAQSEESLPLRVWAAKSRKILVFVGRVPRPA